MASLKYYYEVLNEQSQLPTASILDHVLEGLHRNLQTPCRYPDDLTSAAYEQFRSRKDEIEAELYSRRNGVYNIRMYIYRFRVSFKPDNVRVLEDSWEKMTHVQFLDTCIGDIKIWVGNNPYYGQVISLNEYEDSVGAKHSLDTTNFKYQFDMKAEKEETHAFIEFLYNQGVLTR